MDLTGPNPGSLVRLRRSVAATIVRSCVIEKSHLLSFLVPTRRYHNAIGQAQKWLKSPINKIIGIGTPNSKSKIERIVISVATMTFVK